MCAWLDYLIRLLGMTLALIITTFRGVYAANSVDLQTHLVIKESNV